MTPTLSLKTCKRGHTYNASKLCCPDCRRISNAVWHRANSERVNARNAAWRRANSERVKASDAARYRDNLEKRKASNAAWHRANREKLKANKSAWYRDNLEKHKASRDAWRAENPEKARIIKQRRRARKLALPVQWTAQDWERCLAEFGHRCVYCGRGDVQLTQDHLIPMDDSRLSEEFKGIGGTVPWNMVPACFRCNSSKNNRDPFEHIEFGPVWLRLLGRIIQEPSLTMFQRETVRQ